MKLSTSEVIEVIENFIAGTGGDWDWDDFVSVRITDDRLDSIRDECAGLPISYPPTKHGHYCSDEGVERLKAILADLKADQDETSQRP